jgi:hypothetical protein
MNPLPVQTKFPCPSHPWILSDPFRIECERCGTEQHLPFRKLREQARIKYQFISTHKHCMKQLTDSDPFPFGVHKGKKMMDVPGLYLDWLHGQPWLDSWPPVKEYIERNRKHLDQEIKREERSR